jgi:hypothetical protein
MASAVEQVTNNFYALGEKILGNTDTTLTDEGRYVRRSGRELSTYKNVGAEDDEVICGDGGKTPTVGLREPGISAVARACK